MLSAGIYIARRQLNVNEFMLFSVCILFLVRLLVKLVLSSIYLCVFDLYMSIMNV